MKTNLIGISGKIGSGKDTVGSILQYLSSEEYSNGNYSYASFLVDKDSSYQIKKFADKLKEIVCLLIGCTREQLEDREFKERPLGKDWISHWYKDNKGKKFLTQTALGALNHPDAATTGQDMLTPRTLMQLLGTEAGREIIHPNIWVNALFADYEKVMRTNANEDHELFNMPNWIITDVRFPNEVLAVKNRGGIVIRVNRPLEKLSNSKLPKLKQTSITQHDSETALDNYYFQYFIENDGSIEDLIEKVKELKLI
jgi:hypothetical protein